MSEGKSLTEVTAEITVMSESWYRYVSGDHHKDRDCHFAVTRYWSYGGEPFFEVAHYGYIAEEFCVRGFKSEKEALSYLHTQLNLIIAQEEARLRRNIFNAKHSLDGWAVEDLEENEQGLLRLLGVVSVSPNETE